MSKVVEITAVFLFGLLTIATAIGSGTGRIEGKVFDVETKEPLVGVNIVIEGTTLGAATNTDGSYVITAVPAGEYKLTASMMGYKKLTKSVS